MDALISAYVSEGRAEEEYEESVSKIAESLEFKEGDSMSTTISPTQTEQPTASFDGCKTIQGFVAHLNPQLTSSDESIRYRAMLLISEILRLKPDMHVTPAALHLIILCFCRHLQDSSCIVPALGAIHTLIVHHGGDLSPKHNDTLEILETLIKDVQVQAMIQVVRQKALELVCLLLEHMHKSSMLDKGHIATAALLEGLMELGNGEKDPRCLLLFLRVHRYVPHFELHIAASETLQRRVFYSFACYFPITFEPAHDDPYGMTQESLISGLEQAFVGTPALAELAMPFLSENLVAGDGASAPAQEQGLRIMVGIILSYFPPSCLHCL